MKVSAVAVPVLAGLASAGPVEVEARQSCPGVHIFGARETTAPAGYGTSQGLVNMVKQAYSGATSEAINYPACGGQSQCGGVSYDQSASQGTAAVVSAVTSFNQRCPDTKIVLIGYSQGGQIMDNALCGGAGATLSGNALNAVKAAIFMGDPHNVVGLPYNVGTCQAQGVSCFSSVLETPGSCRKRMVINNKNSSLPAPVASSALRPSRPSSSRTATPPTRTAAPATTPTRTSSTSTSTDSRRSLLSRVSSVKCSLYFGEGQNSLFLVVHSTRPGFVSTKRSQKKPCLGQTSFPPH
jgi:acetylxylan esterase